MFIISVQCNSQCNWLYEVYHAKKIRLQIIIVWNSVMNFPAGEKHCHQSYLQDWQGPPGAGLLSQEVQPLGGGGPLPEEPATALQPDWAPILSVLLPDGAALHGPAHPAALLQRMGPEALNQKPWLNHPRDSETHTVPGNTHNQRYTIIMKQQHTWTRLHSIAH